MVYAFKTQPDLRRIYIASFEEFRYKQDEYMVKLVYMRERSCKGKLLKFFWVGIILHPPEEEDEIDPEHPEDIANKGT